ncbi:hypothetical protein [Deinococcus humi]|uniref:Uncharacterized protein n=1 Tax=Deinococcus humi TaxID=662880 RepID=A0A7W8JRV8_9DEIO|nr:hypothetical protein [Deinococcus humi]MBB5362082.1 hypothetical protein [Deinococcus humi]GGO22148.1 hypothetical protein GCM10008949_09130 [Deinococcus humi]
MPDKPPQTPPPRSPMSKQQRLAQREAILLQLSKGELTQTAAEAALAHLDSPPALRG